MKSVYRLSGLVSFAGSCVSSLPPSGKARSTVKRLARRAQRSTYQTPNFLAFALTSGSDLYNKSNKAKVTTVATETTAGTTTAAMAVHAATAMAKGRNVRPCLRAGRL